MTYYIVFEILKAKLQGQAINQFLISKGEIHIRKHFYAY